MMVENEDDRQQQMGVPLDLAKVLITLVQKRSTTLSNYILRFELILCTVSSTMVGPHMVYVWATFL